MLPTIRSLGADLVVVSPQLPRYLADLKAKQGLDFPLLHDSGNAVAAAFGIAMRLPDELITVYRAIGVDLARFNGDDRWTLPVPTRLVADRAGRVRAVDADPDYTVRPEPEATVAALRALG